MTQRFASAKQHNTGSAKDGLQHRSGRIGRLGRMLGLAISLASCVPSAPLTSGETARPTIQSAVTAPTALQARPGADGIGDPTYPQLGNSGYDVAHYDLNLAISSIPKWELPELTGIVTITARATQDLSAFNLDFQGYTIQALTVAGASADHARSEGELVITPTRVLPAGAIFTTTVQYSGVPAPSRRAITGGSTSGASVGWNRYADDGIYSFNVPSGASTWYPVNDHPRDKATYCFWISVPKPYVVAANGLLLGTTDQGTTTTYQWEASNPLASYLATVNIAQQVVETDSGPNGLPIRNYFPLDFPQERKAAFARTDEMLAFLSERFGPYPFEAYGVVVVNTTIPAFGAMEHQTLSLFSNDDQALSEVFVVHELAHQWFGNSVSLQTWQDVWLKEGFATYAEWLWQEHTEGQSAFTETIRDVYHNPPSPWETYAPVATPDSRSLLNHSVYYRGALTLQALRHRVGDATFFRILQTYTERYRDQSTTTADFVALAEEVSAQDLDPFFQSWLYTRQIPPIEELGIVP